MEKKLTKMRNIEVKWETVIFQSDNATTNTEEGRKRERRNRKKKT
jgi:hypothetical protein